MVTFRDLVDKNQTGDEMYRLIESYSGDLNHVMVKTDNGYKPFAELTMGEAFDTVRRIPYRRDVKPIEVVSRPFNILSARKSGADCKKKAILLSSWARENGIPYRLIASSRKPNRRIHHVFPQLVMGKYWRNFDATYSNYKPFEPKNVTKIEVL